MEEQSRPERKASDPARLPQGAYSSLPGQAGVPPAAAASPSRNAPLVVAAVLIGALAAGLALKMSRSAPPRPAAPAAVAESAPLDGASVVRAEPVSQQAAAQTPAAPQDLGPAPSATPLEDSAPNPIIEAARELAAPRHGTMGSGEIESSPVTPPPQETRRRDGEAMTFRGGFGGKLQRRSTRPLTPRPLAPPSN